MPGKRRGMGYEAIADVIRTRIVSGELQPGEKIPSESQIMDDYDVGRETAYRALQVLRNEGLTVSRQGAPTRVRRFHPIRRSATKRLASEVWGSGTSMWDIDVRDERATPRDIEVTEIDAPTRIASALGIRRGTRVVRRSRRYFLDDDPIMAAVSYLPADIAAGTQIAEEDTGAGGTYARLSDLGHAPEGFTEEMRVRMPTKEEAALLDLQRGTPVILLVRTARDASNRVVEVNEMILDSSAYVLDYEVPS